MAGQRRKKQQRYYYGFLSTKILYAIHQLVVVTKQNTQNKENIY
jgi:hypothetical protein